MTAGWIAGIRATAIAIAIAGVIDPAIRAMRPGRPDIAVVHADAPALADEIERALAGTFNVVRGPFSAAAAIVVAGRALTPEASAARGPAFVVMPDDAPAIEIVAVHAAGRASIAGRVPVSVSVRSGSGATTAEVALDQAGVVTDRATVEFGPAGRTEVVTLWFVPMSAEASRARVRAVNDGVTVEVDIVIDVRPTVWRVLFFDKRPSWMSTFIRRTLESDPRFAIVTRVATSRDVSVDVGGAPSGLGRLADLSTFDTVVVGAPDALTSAEVDGLEAFARRRGGTIVLPLAQRVGGAYDRLMGVTAWREHAAPGVVSVRPVSLSSEPLMATELAWPVVLPEVAEPIALYASGDAEADAPVIWRTPLGAGEVIVSGALDGWRYRAGDGTGFDEFWRHTLAAAASRAMEAITVTPQSFLLRPGETVPVSVVLRDVALAAGQRDTTTTAVVAAAIEDPATGTASRTPVRLWPEGAAGQLGGVIVAPGTPGTYRFVVRDGDDEAAASVLVAEDVSRATPDERARLDAWARSRGGRLIAERALPDLDDAIRDAVSIPMREADWHPMRSPWWMVPFAAALTAEWWWRRRHGQL